VATSSFGTVTHTAENSVIVNAGAFFDASNVSLRVLFAARFLFEMLVEQVGLFQRVNRERYVRKSGTIDFLASCAMTDQKWRTRTVQVIWTTLSEPNAL
jgi:hypothetical protein